MPTGSDAAGDNMKGLVLEGGAMRGMFTAGVLDVFMENNISFDTVVGVSAGAAFGCNFKSRQVGRVLRYNLKYCKDKRYCSVRSLIKTGDIFGAEFCYHTIPDKLDVFDSDSYAASPIAFYVVCTDIETGKAVYHLCEEMDYENLEWIRASASMPLVSKPVTIGGKTYLDGGIADSIPLRFITEQGCEKNVVVLTQPRDYTKKPASMMPLFRFSLRKYPNMIRAIKERYIDYNNSRELVFSQEKNKKVFVICPDEPLPIGRIEHNPDMLQKVYDIGRNIAYRQLESIKQFLNN